MPTTDQIIRALRCTSTFDEEHDCEYCAYCHLTPLDPKWGIEGDTEIDGQEFFYECDLDRILIDAAYKLQSYKDGLI